MHGRSVEPSDLERMSAALAAHGPDGHGIWSRGPVGLVHRQMCFVPEDHLDRQPLALPSGLGALVSAARLDNRSELTQALCLGISQAYSLPDSGFIREAYLRWGSDCPARLVGDFTFAAWDNAERSLLLACSPFSSRPLFYHSSGERFAFATMPKGLFALPGVPRALDEAYLVRYLARRPTPPGDTFYREIRQLPPGHSLLVRDGRTELRSFWEPDLTRDLRLSRDEEYVEAFQELFTRVVKDHLRSSSPVGIMLSGGLDSSSVAAVSAPLLRVESRRLPAFTEVPRVGFAARLPAGRYADETHFVEALARRYETIDLNWVRSGEGCLLQGIDRCFRHTETPFRNACNRLWYEAILAEAGSQGVRVLLTGGQGNLSISWPGMDRLPGLIRQGRLGVALHEAAGLRAFLGRGVLPLLPPSLQTAVSWARSPSIGRQPPARALRQEAAERHGILGKDRQAAPRTLLESRHLRRDLMQRTTGMSSLLGAGYEAEYGVDVRDPTCDVRLVEFCLSLPEDQFRRDGVPRRLLRRAMEGRLPSEILSNPNRGLQAADWAERMASCRESLAESLSEIAGCRMGRDLLDLDRVGEALADVCASQARGGSVSIELRNVLEDGFMTGSFIRWFESGGG